MSKANLKIILQPWEILRHWDLQKQVGMYMLFFQKDLCNQLSGNILSGNVINLNIGDQQQNHDNYRKLLWRMFLIMNSFSLIHPLMKMLIIMRTSCLMETIIYLLNIWTMFLTFDHSLLFNNNKFQIDIHPKKLVIYQFIPLMIFCQLG